MPTYDFIQHILSMSSEVEVLSPDYVRKEVARWIKEMASIYD
jgi:predicted DNA-binding transcriptional regulator YafY